MIPWQRSIAPALLAAAISGTALAANPAPRTWCEDKMVSGTYAIQLSGHRATPGGTEAVIGVVIRQYDGLGGIEQWDNVKGEVTGYTPGRYGKGVYRVNDDCTVDIEFHPAPNVTLQERGVIIDRGNEIRTITVLPAGTMVTATHLRI
jgi:hypothetical protein